MSTTSAEEITREQLRAFHLTGRGLEHARPTKKIRPAGLDRILPKIPRLEAAYPLYVAPHQPPRPLIEVLGGNEAVVRDVAAMMGDRPLAPAAEARAVMSRALEESRIPADGYLIGFHRNSPALLYGAFLTLARRDARTAFFFDVKRCAVELENLLAIDHAGRSPHPAEAVSASLGAGARRFLAASALTGIFDRQSRRRPGMDPDRRARCESALAVLEEGLRDEKRDPSFWLFHSGEALADVAVFGGRSCRHEDSCSAAIEFCDQQLARFTGVLRAVRVARIEIESAFDPEVHSALIDRFDWRSAEPDELAALPAVVIMERPERLATLSMASFARLLRSGRPVQILAPCSGPFADLDFGCLAMVHREAFVIQSSLARWDHLGAGLAEMTRTPRPAIAILSTPAAQEVLPDAWIETALYDLSRAFPLYRFDPSRDGAWAARFQLFEPGVSSEVVAIQAIAISDRFRDHFRLLPPSAPNHDQMEAAEYFKSAEPRAVPFLPIVDGEGNPLRAVFTRELADFCGERIRAWEMPSQLASVQETKTAVSDADFEAARREGAAQAYGVVMDLLADPEKLVRGKTGS